MRDDENLFDTDVRGVAGKWPEAPGSWSYSSLREVEACPRRYMLRRSTYPSVWAKSGYPDRPILPAIMGHVIHSCLERILLALHDGGCEGLSDPRAVEILRSLGGYSLLIQGAIQARLARFSDNPRAKDKIESISKNLMIRIPEMRERLQGLLSRLDFAPVAFSTKQSEQSGLHRGALGLGSYPEVELQAPSLKMTGRADLITITNEGCQITDYKTGAQDEAHKDQLHLYSLLWSRDPVANPDGHPVSKLVVSYGSHNENIDPLSSAEYGELEGTVARRVAVAEIALAQRPPAARPSPDCRLCDVRHLCGEYWTTPYSEPAVGESFGDIEIRVISKNGIRSWNAIKADQTLVLLRAPREQTDFSIGERFRLLDVAIDSDEEKQNLVVTPAQWSEAYLLA